MQHDLVVEGKCSDPVRRKPGHGELGVSERTVARRIARLQEVLGAQTRFQLGVQAGRRGWL
ncbi:hypothetical protein [Streptomyces sp. NPDC051286]|uniref:hypothetical protein n=1 Tax=Streptomyces sp. NPDC051286 TaxID=3365647 RepID=UPI0037BC63C7